MKTAQVVLVIAAVLMPPPLAGQQGAAAAELQLKAAIQAELIDGDLRLAVDAYRDIISRHIDNRAVVAKALLQLGGCYERLGQTEARRTYEQLVRDYADQTAPVSLARTRLAALGPSEAAVKPARPGVAIAMPRVDGVSDLQALSPDGSKALFTSFDKGQNLAVYDFSARQTKLLTEFDWTTAYVVGGIWSPDGRRVAYMQRGFRPNDIAEVRVVTLTGGDSRVIFRNDANPGRGVLPAAWLPDGRTLLAAFERADGTAAIGLVPAAGGPVTPLRSFPWSGKVFRPRLSPDGRFVAIAEGAAGMQDVYVLTIDGRAAYRITEQPGDDVQPVWSPDGRHLVFISSRLGGAALWAVPMREGQAAGEAVRVRDGMQGMELIDWTSRGLVYVDHTQTHDIYTGSVDRSTWQPAGNAVLLAYSRTGGNTGPAWSPDGRFMAFVSGSSAEPDRRHVVVVPEGRGEAREYLIPTTRYTAGRDPYDLRWFGDGSGLGFSGTDRQGQPTVFHLSLATGQWKAYPSPVKTWTRLEWNADGTKFFYARHSFGGGSAAIVERDVAMGVERDIYRQTDKQGTFRGLRLSPDRRSLAFTITTIENGHQTQALMAVEIESRQARTLLEETSGTTMDTSISLGAPAWSPDGRALIVPRTVGQSPWPEFRVVPLDGGVTRSFALDRSLAGRGPRGFGLSGPGIRDVVWSPDGALWAFVLEAFGNDTWLIENVLASAGSASAAPRR